MTISGDTMPLPLPARTPRLLVENSSTPDHDVSADIAARRLVTAIARGDETAFGEFYASFQPRLFRFALVIARGEELLAHDAVQAAFLTAARKLRRVESAEHLWNWLARVVRQHLSKSWRQKQREAAIIGMADLPDCEDKSDSVLEACLDGALQSMNTDERELLEWFYFDQLSHKEIADRLEATPKSVSSRLERTRAKLRAVLTQLLSHEKR